MEEEERTEVRSPEGGACDAGATENEEKHSLFKVAEDQPDWLPSGWVLEIKPQSGASHGERKRYSNPSTGSRFYSRKQLFRHLNAGKIFNPRIKQTRSVTSINQEKSVSNSSPNNALSESHPKTLPNGWTKEISFRTQGTRKYTLYIDPNRRYAFYSMKDAHRYIASGDIRKCIIRPHKINGSETHTAERELYVPTSTKRLDWQRDTTKRCLFSDKRLDLDVKMPLEVNETPQRSSLSSPGAEIADLHCITSHVKHSDKDNSKETKLAHNLNPTCYVNALSSQTLGLGEERMSKSTAEKPLDFVSNKVPYAITERFETSLICFQIRPIVLDDEFHSKVPDEMREANKRSAEHANLVPLQQQAENLPAPEVNLLHEATLEQKNEEQPQPIKRKRGRPLGSTKAMAVKTLPTSEVSSLDETILELKDEEQAERIKRRRGCLSGSTRAKAIKALQAPEVNLLDETILEQKNEEQSQPIKRKRGRPLGSTRAKIIKDLPSPDFSLLDKIILDQKNEEQSQPIKPKRGCKPGSRRAKTNKTPLRASKRLAAIRASQMANSDVHEMSHGTKLDQFHHLQENSAPVLDQGVQSSLVGRSFSQQNEMSSVELVQLDELESNKHFGRESTSQKQVQLGITCNDKPLSPCISPFGDSWTDPCLEFAFKMLTSDIPVLEDSGNVKEYVQQLDSINYSIPIRPASFCTLTSSSQNEYHKF
ncbi:hypothetical protein Cni_G14579 [Canna indica]|uniref:MBD domain-containing protein n=1 Tax=Canna indica TaxID=4628 RepID=A0AAQ3QE43_9LILI|nr:hypothetical protein Cni_G14579 [Canna indica]